MGNHSVRELDGLISAALSPAAHSPFQLTAQAFSIIAFVSSFFVLHWLPLVVARHWETEPQRLRGSGLCAYVSQADSLKDGQPGLLGAVAPVGDSSQSFAAAAMAA